MSSSFKRDTQKIIFLAKTPVARLKKLREKT